MSRKLIFLLLIPMGVFAQKHSLEVGFYPITYYFNYVDYDSGIRGNSIETSRPTPIIRYTYLHDKEWRFSIYNLKLTGEIKPLPTTIEASGMLVSSTMSHWVVDIGKYIVDDKVFAILPSMGVSWRKRVTGVGTFVGPPWNSSRRDFNICTTIGLKCGVDLQLKLPYDFYINHNIGYYRHFDDLATNVISMFFVAGIKF